MSKQLNELRDKDGNALSPVLADDTKNFLIDIDGTICDDIPNDCLLYTSPSPRDGLLSRMPSSA